MAGTIVVWVLLIVTGGSHSEGSVAVVDNIASQANCQALAAHAISVAEGVAMSKSARCVAVRKVRP